jgi:hypothetical protein
MNPMERATMDAPSARKALLISSVFLVRVMTETQAFAESQVSKPAEELAASG